MADDLVVAGTQIFDEGVADEAFFPGDDILRQSSHLRHARVKRMRRIAVERRAGQRGEIIGQREMFGLRQCRDGEGSLTLELGRRQRGKLQSGAECEAVAAELELALDQRRHHQDAAQNDALTVLQRSRDFGGAEAAIAFAENEFRRADADVFGDVEGDHLSHRFSVAVHAPEAVAAFGFGGPAPAGADRIDQNEIGEGEPGVRVVGEADAGSVIVAAERSDARPDEAEVEERRAGARSAVEHESYRPRRVIRFRDEGRVENRSRTLARLIEQRERAGSRRIGELSGRCIDAVLGNGIRRQERKHAGPSLFRPALISVTGAIHRAAAVLLRGGGRGK